MPSARCSGTVVDGPVRAAIPDGVSENHCMATPTKLSDAQAKQLLRGWPSHSGDVVRSDAWPTPHGKGAWLRAQPPDTASRPGPRLRAPGATLFTTQPDGLWVWFGPEAQFADVLAIEVCGTAQNLNDKRSRYGPTTTSLILSTSKRWLKREVGTRGGGKKTRQALAAMEGLRVDHDLLVPVRWLQVLYALPNDVYKSWTAEQIPGPHEYFCRHSSMGSYNSQAMQAFLARMTLRSHFLTEPGR